MVEQSQLNISIYDNNYIKKNEINCVSRLILIDSLK